MRLSRLYSNRPAIFGLIQFRPGLNVVLGEIRLPENRSRSTHNLGKTTLARVIDFCLCRRSSKEFFLFKHADLFSGFVFFLEVETLDGTFVTIRRSVDAASKLSFARHDARWQDYTDASAGDWDHENVPFEAGKQLLDGLLGLTAIKPWDFRIPVGYALRTQNDFTDVFQLSKHRGGHRYWKPYVAHILGFDADLVESGFALVEDIEGKKATIGTLRRELGSADVDLDQIRGLIEIKKKEVTALEEATQRFDFALQDASINTNVVERLDQTIADLNNERYSLSRTRKRLVDSLQAEQIQFRPEAARKLFEEAGVIFPAQVVKEFEDLVRFNKEISKERIEYLKEELEAVSGQLGNVAKRLETLNRQRQAELEFLGDTESVSKYREMNQRLVEMKNELGSMERQRDALLGIREHDKQLRVLIRQREDQVDSLQANIDACGGKQDGRYSRVRAALAGLCERFLNHKALITTRLNKENNIEFQAEYLDPADLPTSEAEGKSYKQALCAAYDLAVTQVLLDEDFIRFVYHDGLLEGFDDRIKLNIIQVLRGLADQGIQQVLTVIDSDLPLAKDGEKFAFDDDEVVLTLHDEGPSGRLFRMETW